MRLRTRAEIDAEPRRAQFVVERNCPHLPDPPPSIEFPFAIWIRLDLMPVGKVAARGCKETQYLVEREHAAPIRARAGCAKTESNHRVCAHMGYICE